MKLIPSELFTVDLETPIRDNKLVNDLFLKNEVKIQYVCPEWAFRGLKLGWNQLHFWELAYFYSFTQTPVRRRMAKNHVFGRTVTKKRDIRFPHKASMIGRYCTA
jgi:hypothetical protein